MRTTAFVLLASMTAFVAGGCKGKTDPTGGGGGSIEGTYELIEMEFGGEKATPEEFAKMTGDKTVTITADTMKFSKANGKEDAKKYKIDSTKSPAAIDLTETEPDGKTHHDYGIYKLEGDTLTILIPGPTDLTKADQDSDPKDRPKEFKTRPKSFDMMFKFKKK